MSRCEEVQTPNVSWDEDGEEAEDCHFHCYHFLLYFKSWCFYGGGTHFSYNGLEKIC